MARDLLRQTNLEARLARVCDPQGKEVAVSLGTGIYYDLPRRAYHEDPCGVPSLSHSIAMLMLDRSPAYAWAHHPRGGGQIRESSANMDEGTLLDSLLLGGDQQVIESPYNDYRKTEARAWRDEQIEAGLLPVKRVELNRVHIAAEQIKASFRLLGVNLDDPSGRNQVTVVWDDALVRCRARLDRLIIDERRGSARILDLKKTACAAGEAVAKSCVTWGYDVQWAAYTSAIETVRPDLAGRVEMEFLFAETEPPYQVRLAPLAGSMRELGRHRWRRALRIWRECLAANRWPGYDSRPLEAPQHALAQMEREIFDETFPSENK